MTAIGDRLRDRGDLKGAGDMYAKAATALKQGDEASRTGTDGPRTWSDIVELAEGKEE